jgi:hypothetical protein
VSNASGGQTLTPPQLRPSPGRRISVRWGTHGGDVNPIGGPSAGGLHGYTKPTLATTSDGEVETSTSAGQARRAGRPLAGAVPNSAEMTQYTADQTVGPTADFDYQSTLYT